MSQTITFFVKPFNYTAVFYPGPDSNILIRAEHSENYYVWSAILTEDYLRSTATKLVQPSPELLFKILSDYCDEKLDTEKIIINFPSETILENECLKMGFSFVTMIYMDSISDSLSIYLEWIPVSAEERHDKKVESNNILMKKYISDLLTEQENMYNKKINDLTTQFNEQLKMITRVMSAYGDIEDDAVKEINEKLDSMK